MILGKEINATEATKKDLKPGAKCSHPALYVLKGFKITETSIPTVIYDLANYCCLYRTEIVNCSLCYFYQQILETIEHIFVVCYLVTEIWIELEKWMTDIFGLKTNLINIQSFLESIHRLENLIILFTKQSILQRKTKTSRLNENITKKSIT